MVKRALRKQKKIRRKLLRQRRERICNPVVTVTDSINDKAGRRCVASRPSQDGELMMFVDSKTSQNYYSSECFLWLKSSGEKIPLPSLPVPEDSFFKCVIRYCNEDDNTGPRVYFFCKDHYRFIYYSPDSNIPGWSLLRYSADPTIFYCDVTPAKFKVDDGREEEKLCFINQNGSFRYGAITVESMGCKSFMYDRKLVTNNVGDQLFLVERRAQGSWELNQIDLLDLHGQNLVAVPNSEGLAVCLIGKYSCLYHLSPEFGFKGNCICFTEPEDDENFYVFWLNDQSLSVFENQPDSGFPIWFTGMSDGLMSQFSCMENEVQESAPSGETEDTNSEITDSYLNDEYTKLGNLYERLNTDLKKIIIRSLHDVKDHANFRFVCRKWAEIARPICWKADQLSTSHTSDKSPWLMFFNNKDECASFIDPINNMKYYYKNNQELRDCKIQYSKSGWLLVTQGKRTIFFFEPFSKIKINLPDLPEDFDIDGMSFSSTPTSSDRVVIAIQSTLEIISVAYLRSDDDEWSKVEAENEEGDFISCGCSPVFHDGKFYCLSQSGDSVIFSLGTEPSLSTGEICYKSSGYFSNYRRGYLVSCDTELYIVAVGVLGKFVEVYKLLNGDRSQWEEMDYIGTYSMFISPTSSFAIESSEEALENTINFPLFAENRSLSYKLDYSEFQFYGGDVCSNSIYERKEVFGGTWIQPKVFQAYRE